MLFICNHCEANFNQSEHSVFIFCPECKEQYGLKKPKKFFDIADKTNLGVTLTTPGIGDGIQFTSLFENYYKQTGEKLIDVSKPWFLDKNPYVRRDVKPSRVLELWLTTDWIKSRQSVYLSNAEIHSAQFGIKNQTLNRPRLYAYEDFPFKDRNLILFHPFGKSHGALPKKIIDHVIEKYGSTGNLFQIGSPKDSDLGIPKIPTKTLWECAKVISKARMLIGVDSGPAWISACYPDVLTKKIRTKFQNSKVKPEDWIPLDVNNPHSFWDDRIFQTFNCTDNDIGFTWSYLKL